MPDCNIIFEPEFEEFKKNYDNGKPSLVHIKRIDDIEQPLTAFAKLGAEKFGASLFESVEGGETRGRYSIVTSNPDLIFEIDDNIAKIASIDENGNIQEYQELKGNPLDALRALIEENKIDFAADIPPPIAGLYGYLSYETAGLVEKIPFNAKDNLQLPKAIFIRPRIVIVFDGVRQELLIGTPCRYEKQIDAKSAYDAACSRIKNTLSALDKPITIKAPNSIPKSIPDILVSSNQTPEEYMSGVKKAKEYIKAGDIFQVVPSQRFSADFENSPLSLYRALRRTNPSPFLFLLQLDGFAIIGSSPEILVRLRDDTVTLRPIAGTRKRGETPALDKALEEELLSDKKELAEHLMLLDLGRNDVGRVAVSKTNSNQSGLEKSGVRVTQKFVVERYSHVMHIVSNVEGTIKPNLDALDALLAGFPAGTVTGAPKIRAMEIISELEPHERGIYAGGVGYFSANGDMDMCIALRTGVLKDKKLYVQAGAGVVLDSIPENEHQECIDKSRALLSAAALAPYFDN